ncbi:phosphatidylethanolamine-binding protein [Ancylostoma ceylanicum]|uniref:Phosphatidylethanolamine-binding protein n=1 Tax=Ancylostoma ceylanicum TaxID=53326 RepID=A0A0D6MDK3_9BILA|nr:phosphatidylethanolamine-binding protein [Ancylostoma ceylanicum]
MAMYSWCSALVLTVFLKSVFCATSDYIRPGLPKLDVTFDGGKKVALGNELTPSASSKKPILNWNASPSGLYTVIMIDVDAPSRKDPFLSDYLHWMVVNIPGSHLKNGDELAPYMGPRPPPGSGPHRYYILLYKQQSPVSSKKMSSRAHKTTRIESFSFDTSKFASQNGLGAPVAGNYFKDEQRLVVVQKLTYLTPLSSRSEIAKDRKVAHSILGMRMASEIAERGLLVEISCEEIDIVDFPHCILDLFMRQLKVYWLKMVKFRLQLR